jgi:hypothetical protein
MKRIILLSIALMSALTLHAQGIEKFVKWQMDAYPETRLLDIYKSCFQDFIGEQRDELLTSGYSSKTD